MTAGGVRLVGATGLERLPGRLADVDLDHVRSASSAVSARVSGASSSVPPALIVACGVAGSPVASTLAVMCPDE